MNDICLYCDYFIIEEQYRTIEFINIESLVHVYYWMTCTKKENEIEISPTKKSCEYFSIGGVQYGIHG